MKNYILPMAFRDLALFHVILFSSICLKTTSPGSKEVPKALMHLRECIRLINERFASLTPMLHDSTFIVIATLAYFEVRIFFLSLSTKLTNILEAQWSTQELGGTHAWAETNGSAERRVGNVPAKASVV
jgi:hypothetical protein